ncbi:2-oxoglutarate and iron-dependent oxygenase domain-containing protein, partial [Pseudomonas aeruginosa]
MSTPSLPIIDIAALAGSDPAARRSVAVRIDRACREQGFFYVVGHGVEAQLVERLERLARQFFALDETSKLRWRMELGGRAWRGYFPLGGELTSNRPDWKEGLYLGSELDAEHPEVRAGTPLHGANLFPEVPGLRETLLEYLDATTRVGHRLMEGIALGLGLEADYFAAR